MATITHRQEKAVCDLQKHQVSLLFQKLREPLLYFGLLSIIDTKMITTHSLCSLWRSRHGYFGAREGLENISKNSLKKKTKDQHLLDLSQLKHQLPKKMHLSWVWWLLPVSQPSTQAEAGGLL